MSEDSILYKLLYMLLEKVGNELLEWLKKRITNLTPQQWEALNSQEIADIIVKHASAAAVAGMLAGVLPGLAALIASGISIGAIWRMYYCIGKYLHIGFSFDLLKAAASAILSNVVHQLWGVLAIEFALTFIPFLAIPATGLIFFAVTYFSGLTFLQLLVRIFRAGGDPANMTAEEIKQKTKEILEDDEINIQEEFKNVKEGFKKMREDGTLDEKGKGVDISE